MWPTRRILHVIVLLIQDGVGFVALFSRMVAFSTEMVLELLQQKDDSKDSISTGEESDLYDQLQYRRIEVRVEYELHCVTVFILRKHMV